mmetsp:Transcript_43605/g.70149  ORF Transcript_43605/g.70149 Transcript_43605/m.70149 type:complete len:90 (-) Transcript_43605:285-554(-)
MVMKWKKAVRFVATLWEDGKAIKRTWNFYNYLAILITVHFSRHAKIRAPSCFGNENAGKELGNIWPFESSPTTHHYVCLIDSLFNWREV